jgi:hypothetical protein
MTQSYRSEVGAALEVLAEGLAPFVDRQMRDHLRDDDWIVTAATKLGRREPVLASATDPQFQLEVMVRWWGPVFAPALSKDTRDRVQELRKARNSWAHIDDTRPIDLEYARRVHLLTEDLLQEIGSPMVDRIGQLAEALERSGAQHLAAERGISESDALVLQLTALQADREALTTQLEQARHAAQTAAGRQRAVARQLAELQAQYAAVSGLRERYRELQAQLAEAQKTAQAAPSPDAAAEVDAARSQLDAAASAIIQLQEESSRLHQELEATRRRIEDIDPVETPAGRRWLMLVSALLIVIAVAVVVLANQSTAAT